MNDWRHWDSTNSAPYLSGWHHTALAWRNALIFFLSTIISLGIPEDERDGKLDKDQRQFRLEALHIHGVGKMVAEDIYDYFKEFNPISYEWVDSKSVNVGWALSSTSAQALLALSRPILEAEDEAMEVNERVVDENGEEEPKAKPEPLTKEELLAKVIRLWKLDYLQWIYLKGYL